jgi:hypothetical protein
MPDHDSTARVLQNQVEEALGKLAIHRGLDAAHLLEMLNDALQTSDRVEPVDMVVWLSTEVLPVEPEIGVIVGRDTGLFYRGCVNMLYGTDGCGKTLLMQRVIYTELEAGNEVLFLDAEEGSPRNMVLRLQQMGIDPEWGSRLHYFNLDRPPSPETRKMFVDFAKRCSLVVIDSAGELMGMYGKDATKDLETRGVLFEMFGRPLAKEGPAVVFADHISKSSDGSMPIGSIRKRAAIDGAAYYLAVDEGNEWSKTRSGYAGLTCTKDRHGTYYRGEHVARVQVFPAAVSATGELIVELSWTEFDDITDEELIDHTPPARSIPDEDAFIIDIVNGSPSPVGTALVITMLKTRGIEMTKTALRERLAFLVSKGWIAGRDDQWSTAPLHSV